MSFPLIAIFQRRRPSPFNLPLLAMALWAATAGVSRADVVILSNGDKLNGKVGLISGDLMKFNSPALGEIVIKLSAVKSYSTDAPATLLLKNRKLLSGAIKNGNGKQITTADGNVTPAAIVKEVNPPGVLWTGTIVANGALNRGNTNNETVGLSANAVLRRDNADYDDRLTLNGAYNYVKTGRGSSATTTADNWTSMAKYDRFFNERLYAYANTGYDHDRIARLIFRLTPGIGFGYQWIERPNFKFNTEAGLTFLYQDFENKGDDQKLTLRLAYHLTKELNDRVAVFHNVEWLPAFEDPADYVLTADAGIRANFTKKFFSELKVVYKRNDRPAPGTLKDDLAFLVGLGWKF